MSPVEEWWPVCSPVLEPSPLILFRLISNSNDARLHLQFKVCSGLTFRNVMNNLFN